MIRTVAAWSTAALVLACPALGICQEWPAAAMRAPERDTTIHDDRHPAFLSLVKSLKDDFRRAASRESLTLIGLGASAAWSVHGVDRVAARSSWGANDMFRPGNLVGSALAQGGGAFATYLLGRAIDQPEVSRLGADLVRAQIVSQSFTQAIKFSATRTRPDGTSLSFPSGHTSSAFATATVIQSHYGWKAGVPAYAVAGWIAASRVQMKRHFVSDVVTGAAIGVAAGRAVTFGLGGSRFAMVPTGAPSGSGIGVSLVRLED